MENIKWAPLIPLIGGQMLGAEAAFGKPPEAIYSYTPFAGNDSHYVNYQQNTMGRSDIKYIHIDEEGAETSKVDVISGTPPCAALSQLNTGKSEETKGATCGKNDWMYEVFKQGIDRFEAKVIVVENAPALYTNKGRGVANKLFKICEERGYSLTLYKTSTMYHGIPQARDRTFAIGWKSETAPIMDFHKKDHPDFLDYLDTIPEGTLHYDLIANTSLANEPWFRFLKHKFEGRDPREVMIEANKITAFTYVNKSGMLKEANEWFHLVGDEKGIKYSEHAIKKFADGLGIWDNSTHVFDKRMNAVIGRNLSDTLHPKHDRSLTIREALHLMGFPHNFELLGGRSKINHIAQNVPVPTSRDIHIQIKKFLEGKLAMSDTNYLRQNNHNETIEFDPLGIDKTATLENFFA